MSEPNGSRPFAGLSRDELLTELRFWERACDTFTPGHEAYKNAEYFVERTRNFLSPPQE